MWPIVRVAFSKGGLLCGWHSMRGPIVKVAFHECGLLCVWPSMMVVFCEGGIS